MLEHERQQQLQQLIQRQRERERERDGGERGEGVQAIDESGEREGAETIGNTPVATDKKRKRVFDSIPTPVAAVIILVAILIALASAVVCSYCLVQSIEPPVRSTYEGPADTAGNGGFPVPMSTVTLAPSQTATAGPLPSSTASSALPASATLPDATSGTRKGYFVPHAEPRL